MVYFRDHVDDHTLSRCRMSPSPPNPVDEDVYARLRTHSCTETTQTEDKTDSDSGSGSPKDKGVHARKVTQVTSAVDLSIDRLFLCLDGEGDGHIKIQDLAHVVMKEDSTLSEEEVRIALTMISS